MTMTKVAIVAALAMYSVTASGGDDGLVTKVNRPEHAMILWRYALNIPRLEYPQRELN